MNIKTAFIFMLLVWETSYAFSANVTGKISDQHNQPLPGATIMIANTLTGTVTDFDGNFNLELPVGTHVLEASSIGFENQSQTIIIKSDKDYQLNFVLKESTSELQEVVITAESIASKLESKGFAMKAVEMKDAEMSSLQANDVLDRVSGVRIRQTGGMGSRVRYNINGLSGNAIRVFIDGVPIQSYGPSFSLSSIPTNMIERIEVYKGVVPVELSSDALGGAINVILKKNTSFNSLSGSYSIGSFNTHQGSLSGSYFNKERGLTARANAFYNYSDNDYDVWGNQVYTTEPATGDITYVKARRFHDSYQSAGYKADVGFSEKKWADDLTIGTVYSQLKRDLQHGATMESVYGERTAEQTTKQVNFFYKDQTFFDENLSLQVSGSYSKLNRLIIDTCSHIYDWDGQKKVKYNREGEAIGYYEYATGAEAGNPTLQSSDEFVHMIRGVSHYKAGDHHSFTASYLYTRFYRDSHDPMRHVDIRNLEDTRFTSKSILGLSYDLSFFSQKLKLTPFYKNFTQSVRIIEYKKLSDDDEIELNDVTRSVHAHGVGFTVAYELFPKFLILTSGERSFRMPVANELFGNLAENLEPNYNLKPEMSKNLNVGFTLGTFNINHHEFKIQFNTFIRDTQDKIKRNVREDDTDETTEYVNDGGYLSRGFDLDMFYSYDRSFQFKYNLSVFNSRFTTQFDDTGLPYTWYMDRERNAPFFTSNINLKYNISDFIQYQSRSTISTNIGFVQWFYRDWESLGGAGKDIIPTQVVLDISYGYTFPDGRITLTADVRNLLDNQVFDNYALQKPGRAFYFKINFNINSN